jgi:hypothetical protein
VFLLDEEDDSAYGKRPGEFEKWSQDTREQATADL